MGATSFAPLVFAVFGAAADIPMAERAHPITRSTLDRHLPAAATTQRLHEVEVPVVIDAKAIARIARVVIPLTHNEVTETYLEHFLNTPIGKGTMKAWLKRAGRYLRLFERELAREGLPRELVWLASMESGFRATVTSWAGARGLWQFMPKTGARYALRQTEWVDERRDPVKATRAAARHLRDLYEEFKDWHLALAAYNTGAGYVNAGIRKHRTRDFFELRRRGHWARETGNYVPKFIAVTRLATSHDAYAAFRGLLVPESERTATVTLYRATDLRRLAKASGLSFDALREMNPELNYWCTPPAKSYLLHVPTSRRAEIAEVAARLADENPERFVIHTVKRGERLARIATRYRISAKVLAARNGLDPSSRLKPRSRLVVAIPDRSIKVASAALGRER